MKITLSLLNELGACKSGIAWFNSVKNKPKTLEGWIDVAIKKDGINYGNWLITRIMNNEQRVSYAIFAAEQVIDIFEKQYPNDDRPRKAIEVAKAYLKNPNLENYASEYASAASAASEYASEYASAASAASEYASDYASDYASEYASAAYASAYAAAASASAAAASAYAAREEMQIRILKYGIGLINK